MVACFIADSGRKRCTGAFSRYMSRRLTVARSRMPPAARRGSLLLRDMSSTERGLSRICRVPAHQAAAAVRTHATRRAKEQRPAGRRVRWASSGGGMRRRTPAVRAGKCTAAARANAARAPPRCLAICFWALDGPVCMIGLAVFWCGRPMVPVPVAVPRREVRTARCPGRAVLLLEARTVSLHRCPRVCSTCRVTRTRTAQNKKTEKYFLQRMFLAFP
jgi:hypothetical protein